MDDQLTKRVATIARDAAHASTEEAAAAAFDKVATRLGGPMRLAIVGKVKAGKSTLLNAIIGEELAPTDAGECTRILTWYQHSDRPYAIVHPHDREASERPYSRRTGALQVDLGDLDAGAVDHLEIGWPSGRLKDLVLIDTPGIASISQNVSLRTQEAFTAESGHAPIADAVLYLLRHTHASDIRFLEAFQAGDVVSGTPVNTVGVLSRADEIGSSRLDAMEVADRVARRYVADSRLHRLCPVVVPVNGLLGHAAATLRESEYTSLATIAGASKDSVHELLLTADRFGIGESEVAVTATHRAALLDRLGLYGVRLSLELIRNGSVTTSSDLARALADVSGLDRLRDVVLLQFEARARVLKARSAVSALRTLLQHDTVSRGADLLQRLEQVTSSAHAFEEVRILLELRSGDLSLSAAREAELDLLMGGAGHDQATRLGLSPDASQEEMHDRALAALQTWQGVARHPLSSRSVQLAARAAVRTIEGFLAAEDSR